MAAPSNLNKWIQENEHRLLNKTVNTVINIPVVVHVVYANGTQNISDAQIQSQIQVLNDDFSKNNSDFNSVVPSVFQPLAADVEFNFCLAQFDSSGTPTSGITRTATTVGNIGTIDNTNIFKTNSGGKDGWDNNKYLNIHLFVHPHLYPPPSRGRRLWYFRMDNN